MNRFWCLLAVWWLAASANAAVIYHDVAPDSLVPQGGNQFEFNFDIGEGSLTVDMLLGNVENEGVYSLRLLGPLLNDGTNAVVGAPAGNDVYRFAAGAEIGPASTTLPNVAAAILWNESGGGTGPWAGDNTPAFAGFRFDDDLGNDHFGWMQLSVDPTTGAALVLDWAYNDVANASIIAGDMGTPAVPEPGTLILAGFAVVAAAAGRRRR
jgi:hypothetical protein